MNRFKQFFHFLAKFLTVTLALLSLALVIIAFVRPDWIKTAIEWIGALIHTLGYWNYAIAFLSACLESFPIIGTAIPGMNIMILVGGFWGTHHVLWTIVLASLGAMLGNYIGYWIGKWYGHSIIEKYGDYIGLGRTEQKILEKQIEKNGFWYIVLGKFHNFTRAFVPFIAGASGMREKNFWVYNMIGSVIWASSIILLGIFFIDRYEMIFDNFGKITTVLLLVVGLYFWFYRRESLKEYWRDKNAEIEAKIQKKQSSHK